MSPRLIVESQVLQSSPSLDNLPSVLTEAFVADLLGVPVERLRKWSYDGRGPKTFKAGNRRLIRREAFLSWFTARER
ncbi:MAG: transcriptional regulator [Alphaproteobacteria bacterium]|nr:MAG: transcriptional regulator [Alphaproteobacteria bacterium]